MEGGDPLDGLEDLEGGSNDKPFDDEPFDAGVEADETEDPEKYIQQLSGKLGQSLRKYTEDIGQPDFDLEKFAINSVISATHTAEMDDEDQKDIINKVKTSGKGEEDIDVDVDVNTGDEDLDIDAEASDDIDFGAEEDVAEENYTPVLEDDNPCWKGYEQIGMKTKGGKEVPNCVPIKENINEAEYQGKTVKLNKPMRGDVKKYKVYVKNDKGNVVKVNFGDKNMEIKRDDPERRKSFRARHKCDSPGPKWKARYWSCKMWSTKSVSSILESDEKSSNFVKHSVIKDKLKEHHDMNYKNYGEYDRDEYILHGPDIDESTKNTDLTVVNKEYVNDETVILDVIIDGNVEKLEFNNTGELLSKPLEYDEEWVYVFDSEPTSNGKKYTVGVGFLGHPETNFELSSIDDYVELDTMSENNTQPDVAPTTKPDVTPTTEPTRRQKPWRPTKQPKVNPKADSDNLILGEDEPMIDLGGMGKILSTISLNDDDASLRVDMDGEQKTLRFFNTGKLISTPKVSGEPWLYEYKSNSDGGYIVRVAFEKDNGELKAVRVQDGHIMRTNG